MDHQCMGCTEFFSGANWSPLGDDYFICQKCAEVMTSTSSKPSAGFAEDVMAPQGFIGAPVPPPYHLAEPQPELPLSVDDEFLLHMEEIDKFGLSHALHKEFEKGETVFTPLAYAAVHNKKDKVDILLELGAKINQRFNAGRETALTFAIKFTKRDCTDMVRVLLSKGADPRDADADDMADHLNVTMRYWLRMAKAHPYYPGDHALPTADSVLIKATRRLQPCNLHRIPELWFGILGQRYAAHEMFPRFVGHLTSNPGEPLVVLMPGPPGHGKTFSADTAALNIVQTKADIKSISCSQIKGDADLFGRADSYGVSDVDGMLLEFLRDRQDRTTVIILDEFEKLTGLTSGLGHDQGIPIFQSLFGVWDKGYLIDTTVSGQRNPAQRSIDCRKTIWLIPVNMGQDVIVEFAETHKHLVYEQDMCDSRVKNEILVKLVQGELKPFFDKFYKRLRSDGTLAAFSRRIDLVVPYMPFSNEEQLVGADVIIRKHLAPWRLPLSESGGNEMLVENLTVHHSEEIARFVAKQYDANLGMTSFHNAVQTYIKNPIMNEFICGKLEGRDAIWLDIVVNDERDRSLDTVAICYAKPARKPQGASREAVDRVTTDRRVADAKDAGHGKYKFNANDIKL